MLPACQRQSSETRPLNLENAKAQGPRTMREKLCLKDGLFVMLCVNVDTHGAGNCLASSAACGLCMGAVTQALNTACQGSKPDYPPY